MGMTTGAGAITFAARLLIGALLVVAGALKVGHFDELAASIAGFRILPQQAIAPLAVLLPFLEIGVGLYLLAGLFTRAAAALSSLLFAIYAAAIVSALLRRLPVNCGCFGPADRAQADWPHAAMDVVLALICVFVVLRAPGPYSIDERLRRV